MNDSFITVYHGTKNKFVNDIKTNGLVDKHGNSSTWYMVATDIESALFHAHPDKEGADAYVIEFKIPNVANNKWDGYPFLWRGYVRNSHSTWYALKQDLPKKFIRTIHKIKYSQWLKQKQTGF